MTSPNIVPGHTTIGVRDLRAECDWSVKFAMKFRAHPHWSILSPQVCTGAMFYDADLASDDDSETGEGGGAAFVDEELRNHSEEDECSDVGHGDMFVDMELSDGEEASCGEDVGELEREAATQGIVNEILLPYYYTNPHLVVEESVLHGVGVFAVVDIPCCARVSWYPGKVCPTGPQDRVREYAIAISQTHVIDAVREVHRRRSGIAHLLNTCHPYLPPPYQRPNCEFVAVPHPRRVGIMGVVAVTTRRVIAGMELLADYHWFVTGHGNHMWCSGRAPLPACADTPCEQCINALAFSNYKLSFLFVSALLRS